MNTNNNVLNLIRLKWFSIVLSVIWVSIFILIFTNSLSSTPLQFSLNTKSKVAKIFPEGWGFFTKNPREAAYDCLVPYKGYYKSLVEPCTNKKYLFGISRECRVVDAEIQHLSEQISDSLWLQSKGDISYDEFQAVQDTIQNIFVKPTILGEVVLVKRERIPWAWSKNYFNIHPPSNFITVYVSRN